MVMKEIS